LWHRTLDESLTYIDIDCVEYCSKCKTPLALIETVRYVGQPLMSKPYTITRRLALMANLPAYVVGYSVVDEEVTHIHLRQVAPTIDRYFTQLLPKEFEQWLLDLRSKHECST
jgi:hypothetical protein